MSTMWRVRVCGDVRSIVLPDGRILSEARAGPVSQSSLPARAIRRWYGRRGSRDHALVQSNLHIALCDAEIREHRMHN
jgi:hypothetical protein